jgi:hypothetical protein
MRDKPVRQALDVTHASAGFEPAPVAKALPNGAELARVLLGLRGNDIDAARVPVDTNFVLGLLARKL